MVQTPGDSHAGGLVFRTTERGLAYLIVRARRDPSAWVLPKGHIEPGESPEAAAIREVEEEAGCVATIVGPLGRLDFGEVRTCMYLMRFEREAHRIEDREAYWGPADEVRERLTFANARELLDRGEQLIAGTKAPLAP